MKKLNQEELSVLNKQLDAYLSFDFHFRGKKESIELVKEFYPSSAAYFILHCQSEYNDEDYSMRVDEIKVYDKEHKELEPLLDLTKDDNEDKFNEARYRISSIKPNCGEDESDEITVYLVRPAMPEVYQNETSNL